MNLEAGFHQEMVRIYEEAKEFGYYPSYFLGMVVERGGLSAAKRLLVGSQVSNGFARLWEEGRLDLSVEAIALQNPWSALFTHEELAQARRRLDEVGYDLGG